jgi:hypothetical protein
VTLLTVVPLRSGPSQGNDKNLGRSLIAVRIPNQTKDKGLLAMFLITRLCLKGFKTVPITTAHNRRKSPRIGIGLHERFSDKFLNLKRQISSLS